MNKMNGLWEEWFQLRISLTGKELCAEDGSIDTTDNTLQKAACPVSFGDDRFPVPLVNIKRMKVIQLLIGTDSIHIGIDTIARLNGIISQRQSFPLCQRVHNLSLCFT